MVVAVVFKLSTLKTQLFSSIIRRLHPLLFGDACDAIVIIAALLLVMREYGLNIEYMSAVGTNIASVMVGIRNGVIMKLKL